MRDNELEIRWTPPLVFAARADLLTTPETYLLLQAPDTVRLALEALDKLADEMSWVPRDRLHPSVDNRIRHLLALGEENPRRRLRTVVARAYSEAFRVETAYQRRMHDPKESKYLAKKLRGVVQELRGSYPEEECDNAASPAFPEVDGVPEIEDEQYPRELWFTGLLERTLEVLERRPMVDPSFIAQWRDAYAPRIISELTDLVLLLEQYSPATLRKGAHEKIGRTFFLIRLAEAFSLLTSQRPSFHATRSTNPYSKKGGKRSPQSQWYTLISAALLAVAMPGGDQGLDGALRQILRENSDCREIMKYLATTAKWAASGRPSGEVEYRELLSVALLRRLRLPL